MPKTKLQGIALTVLSAFPMVYLIVLYNISSAGGKLENRMFLYAFRAMWLFFPIAVIAVLLVRPLAQKLTFRLLKREDRPVFILLMIQSFTVSLMVPVMAFIATGLRQGFTMNFVPQYFTAVWHNFVFALCLQIFAAGPLARFLFRAIFRRQLAAPADS